MTEASPVKIARFEVTRVELSRIEVRLDADLMSPAAVHLTRSA